MPKCTDAASSPASSTLAASVQPAGPRTGRSFMVSSAFVPFAGPTRGQAPAQTAISWPRGTVLNRTRR
jgi:hypothetical protein